MSEGERSVLVTGGAQGLGEAVVRGFAAAGYAVAIADIDSATADTLAETLRAAGTNAVAMPLDVRDKGSFQAALENTIAAFGTLDVLVNNAAVTQVAPLFDITPEAFDEVLAVNLKGTFIGCQVIGAHMRDAGSGRIINLASLAAQNGGAATGAHYAASKGGILTLTKVFARDLAAHGITVNAIAPGPLDLDNVRALLPPDKLAAMVATIPAAQLGSPAFIADMAVMLASPNAASVTGATWDANGGLYLR